MRPTQAPTLLVALVLAGGLAVTALFDWQPGVSIVAAAMLLGAVLRLALPARQAGWLVVRSRGLDAGLLLALGAGLLVLANTVPRR